MAANETQATIADLQATLKRLTAAVEAATRATESRLSSIEARLAALEAGGEGALERAILRVGAIEGTGAVQARLEEVLVRLMDQETLESLGRVAVLAPRLEYALHAAAAAPELLEEALGAVRRWSDTKLGGAGAIDRRIGEGIALLVELTQPKRLAALRRASERLTRIIDEGMGEVPEGEAERGVAELAGVFAALGRPDVLAGLRATLDMLPRLSETVAALPVQPRTLELLRGVNQALEEASPAGAPVGVWGLLRLLREPEIQAVVRLGIDVARRLGRKLDPRPIAQLRS
ncbi:DUF1641 domain-containing protein [Sorangium sp. So ce1024]|uniref:DUF1641 domain-containing protein n=1 Tax=Sorangium sp. So ce1024 TaxID=3133327 RepID=UPI003EFE23AC